MIFPLCACLPLTGSVHDFALKAKQVDAKVSTSASTVPAEPKKPPKGKKPPGPADDATNPDVVSLLKGHKTEVRGFIQLS